MGEQDAMAAVLLNSELMQHGMAQIIADAIGCMQQLDMQTAPALNMNFRWYGVENVYSGYMKVDDGRGADSLDWMFCQKDYQGVLNSYDTALEWMVGDCSAGVSVICVQDSATEKTYQVKMEVYDRFDFSLANSAGFKLLMSGFGMLMFKEFDWNCQVEFTLTIPYSYDHCSHSTRNYHWTLDNSDHALVSDGSGVYTENNGVHKSKTVSDGTVHHYYALDKTVRLLHNKPWVLEYDVREPGCIAFEPVENAITKSYPQIKQISTQTLYTVTKDYVMASNPANGGSIDRFYAYNYCGTKLNDLFSYSFKTLYNFRLENELLPDGSNMVYLTVTDLDSGTVCIDKVPMDDLSYYGGWMEKTELRDTNSRWLNGKDVYINYLGNALNGLSASYLDFRIWENGVDVPDESYVERKEVNPTCTESGGVTTICSRCGYSYQTDVAEPLGHSFGEYSFDNNATCVTDGTQTRKCTRCGGVETVVAPNTALGHAYKATVTEPTYEEQGYTTYTCTVCGDEYVGDYVDVKKHSYVAEVTAPTCIEQGYTTYTCSECGDSYVDDYTEIVDHTPVIDPAVKATCSEKGKTEGSHCGVCGYVIKKQALISTNDSHNMKGTLISMPTYDMPGQVAYICQDCGKTDYLEIPPLEKPTAVNPFTDVAESDWFYAPVLWAVAEGVTGGKTETTFAPNEGCTRAQVVTFLWAANGKPEPVSMDNPFTDVAGDAWYLKPVLWAVENGITTGISATEFGPEQTCTRAQIATFLWAANGKMPPKGQSEFVDVADGDWYAAPIIWAKENDITGGIGDGKFGPNDTCTRAQVVTFLKKVYDK